MKKIFYTAIIGIFVCFSNCSPGSQIESITLNDSGELKLSIKTGAGDPVSGAKVDLYDATGDLHYDRLITNESGMVNFGKYNSGTYFLTIEAEAEDQYFSFSRFTQVVAGENKNIDIDLEEYKVSFDAKVYDFSSGELVNVSDVIISIVPHDRLSNPNDEESIIEAIGLYGISQPLNKGIGTFERIPVGTYRVILHTEDNRILHTGWFSIGQYNEDSQGIYVNEIELNLLRKPAFSIISVRDLYTSEDLAHNYSTFGLTENNLAVLTYKDGSSYTGHYSLAGNPEGSYISISWSGGINDWYAALYESNGESFTLTFYDYNLNREVVITLE